MNQTVKIDGIETVETRRTMEAKADPEYEVTGPTYRGRTGDYYRVGAYKPIQVKARFFPDGPAVVCGNRSCVNALRANDCEHVRAVNEYILANPQLDADSGPLEANPTRPQGGQ